MSSISLKHKFCVVPKKDCPIITLVFPDGFKETYYVGAPLRGVKHDRARPVGIEWYSDSNNYICTEEEKRWLYTELYYIFDPKIHFNTLIKGLIDE